MNIWKARAGTIFICLFSILVSFATVRAFYISSQAFSPPRVIIKHDDDFIYSGEFFYLSTENFDGVRLALLSDNGQYSYNDYLKHHSIDPSSVSDMFMSDRIYEVVISLSNSTHDTKKVNLMYYSLEAKDSIASPNFELLGKINGGSQGFGILMTDIELNPGEEQTLVLPFMLFKDCYKKCTWEKMDNYFLYLNLSRYPNRTLMLLK